MSKRRKIILYLLVAMCAMLWGMSFFGTKVAITYFAPIQVLALRWTVGALLFIILAATKIIKVEFKGKPVKKLLILGFIQPCIYSLFETMGISMTTTSESSIIIAMIPLMVIFIGRVFLKQHCGKQVVLAVLIAFTGIILCVGFSPNFSLGSKSTGYLLLLGAAITGGLYSFSSSDASKHFTTTECTFVMALMGAPFFNIICVASGYGFKGFTVLFSDTGALMSIVFLGVCCSCICYLIYNYALAELPTAVASNLVGVSTTSVGVLSGCIFAGDAFGWYTVVGVGLAVTGICLSGAATAKKEE